MRHALTTILALIGIATVALADPPEEAAKDSVLLPLAVGNSWTMEMRQDGGTVTKEELFTFDVTEEVMLAGVRGYRFGPKGDDDMILSNGPGGLYIWSEEEARSFLLLPYPAKAGDVHAIEAVVGASESATVTVVDTRAQVLAGGTMFTCYHYRIGDDDAPGSVVHLYVAPNVGLVKLEVGIVDGDEVEGGTGILVKYSLRGSPEVELRGDVK